MSEEMKINVDRGENYTKYTVTQPLFTRNEELQLDNCLHDIVRDINNCYVHDKELAIMQEVTRRMEQENQQLQNNWNELKRILLEMYTHTQYTGYLDIINKMTELERGEE